MKLRYCRFISQKNLQIIDITSRIAPYFTCKIYDKNLNIISVFGIGNEINHKFR